MLTHKTFELSTYNRKGWLFAKTGLLLGAIVSLLWSIYFAVVTISIPYQIELREGTAQVMTAFLLNRSNPFVLEAQPLAMNNYGLGYNLMVVPFAALFGNTLFVHRSVTFAFILLSAFAGFLVVYRIKKDLAPALACAAFIMIGLIARGGIGAFPSAMGTFLFMMAILIPFLQGFHPTSLVCSVLFSIAAFYTKAYFVLAVGVVLSYLFLFVSKRTGLLYGVFFLMLFGVSLVIIRLAFPLYFVNTIIGNLSNAERSPAHLFSQLTQLLIYFLPVLGSSLFLLRVSKDPQRSYPAVDVRNWRSPLVSASPDYLLYSSLCLLLVFILFLGSHIGSYLNYAYQLVIPIFFCWFFLKLDLQGKLGTLITIAILFNLFFWGRDVLSPQMLKQKDSEEWSSLYSYVQSSSNILNAPVVTSAVVELGLNPLDSGQTSYFYSMQPYANHGLLGPSYDILKADGLRYVRFIDSSIEKQKFDLVLTTREKSTFYHARLLEKFYTPILEIQVDMPHTGQQWTVLLWRPQTR